MSKISIIMPAKNAGKWIEKTVYSIIGQSYPEWELLIINDRSTDDTADIAAKLAATDIRIRFFHNEDRGIIAALQLGLKRSKGFYVTRMDADDIMPTDRLQTLVNQIEKLPPRHIATGKVKYFSDSGISEGYQKYENWLNERIDHCDHWKHIFRECVIASPNWLVRKDDLIQDRIFNKLQYPEDYSMCFLWLFYGYQISASSDVTLNWREHPERTSRNSEIYQQDSFFSLKLKWFNQLHPSGSVGVLGAGQKGKLAVNHLRSFERKVSWYDLKHEKYNSEVSGIRINHYEEMADDLVLIAIYPENRNDLEKFLNGKGYTIGNNSWYL